MAFSACRDCPHYNRGAGSGKCLNCPRYKDVINGFPDRDTIRVVSVPQAIIEEVADSSTKDFSMLGFIRKLDLREGAVALLRYYGRYTIEEIAETLTISPSTVKRLSASSMAHIKIMINESKCSVISDLDLPF